MLICSCFNRQNVYASQRSILLIIVILLLGCNSSNLEKKDTICKVKPVDNLIQKKDSLFSVYKGLDRFSYKKTIANGLYSLEIETLYLNDTLSIDEAFDTLTAYPIIEKQILTFRSNGIVNNSFPIPIKSIYKSNLKGNKVKQLEADIWNVSIIKGKKGAIFSIDATGWCKDKGYIDFTGFYSMEGQPLFQSYANKYNKKRVHEIFDKYEISNATYISDSKKGIRIDRF